MHIQLIRFELAEGQAEGLIAAVTGELEDWIADLDGFVSATFHAAEDGAVMVNYAEWRDTDAFQTFLDHPRQQTLRQAIGRFSPRAVTTDALTVIRRID